MHQQQQQAMYMGHGYGSAGYMQQIPYPAYSNETVDSTSTAANSQHHLAYNQHSTMNVQGTTAGSPLTVPFSVAPSTTTPAVGNAIVNDTLLFQNKHFPSQSTAGYTQVKTDPDDRQVPQLPHW